MMAETAETAETAEMEETAKMEETGETAKIVKIVVMVVATKKNVVTKPFFLIFQTEMSLLIMNIRLII